MKVSRYFSITTLICIFTASTSLADGPNTNYICSKVINGNVNSSSTNTITGGQITLTRRIYNGASEVDVNPLLTCTSPCQDITQVSPAAHWFSGINPYPNNNSIITLGPLRETDSTLDIRVEGGSTFQNGNKTYMVRHALHLDKNSGILSYTAQVKTGGGFGTGLSSYETRIAVQLDCH